MKLRTASLTAAYFVMLVVAPGSSLGSPQVQRAAFNETENSNRTLRFDDIYNATWEEIPIPREAFQNFIWATSITDDGTIAGKQGDAMVLWHPGTQVWERVPRVLAPKYVLISPDGSSVIATADPYRVLTWNRVDGWQPLAGSTVTQSVASNVSKNFRFAAGGGGNNGDASQAWVWALDGGVQQLLQTPIGDGIVAAQAEAVSNDGNVVIGNALRPTSEDGFYFIAFIATRWIAGGPPTILHDPDGRELPRIGACNADCSIVFGDGPWLLKDTGEFEFMGNLPDGYPWTEDSYGPYHIHDASSDGSMAVGLYLAKANPENSGSEVYIDSPFLWTQATGMTSLRSLGIGDDDWDLIATVRLSPNGRLLLLAGVDKSSGNPRAAVVHLTPKTARPARGHSRHAIPPASQPASKEGSQTGSRLE